MPFIYLIPFVGCIVLGLLSDFNASLQDYVIVVGPAEAVALISHYLFLRHRTGCYEFLGSIVKSIHHEDPWTEIVVTTEVRTDSKGRTYTVTRVRHRHHPERFYFYNSRGKCIVCNGCFYDYVRHLWGIPENEDRWYGADIVGGVRYGQHCAFDELEEHLREDVHYWVPVTERSRYTNRIRHSNSIFKFEQISKARAAELGLHDYPRLADYDVPCILWGPYLEDLHADELFRKFNGYHAPKAQMRLFILIFDARQGISISELQRAYWQGGNKNEFVICIGLDDNRKVEWARAFSWADEQQIEVETARWLMDNPDLDWDAFYNRMVETFRGWRRKEFSDFNYIRVTLTSWQTIAMAVITALTSALTIYLILKDEMMYMSDL